MLASNPGTVEVPLNENDGDIKRGMTSLALENEYERHVGEVFRLYYNFGNIKLTTVIVRGNSAGLPF